MTNKQVKEAKSALFARMKEIGKAVESSLLLEEAERCLPGMKIEQATQGELIAFLANDAIDRALPTKY